MKTLPYVFFALLLTTTALAQPARQTQLSNTTENLRGISAVSQQIAWASGTHGTYLRTTDAGRTWIPAQVPDAANLDFRGVVAFSADEAFLMSAGPGDQSRIYHTIRRRPALATPVHQYQSQSLLRLHRLLGSDSRRRPR
jgi:photosystem II stability/assembly factor-like uncharacterized protein